ncbi:MAG: tRNA (guanine(10)-N(2))-dimethyltransferase [Methanoregulaceae archaeon]|nr:tRNA (guanine(10)-N(2))-dimethyltransferase [Methanoregulaceae archaeon]
MDLVEVKEGQTRFLVPQQNPDVPFPPGTAAVFYNRRMEINRDATILLTSIIKPSQYLDAMGATGVRGLRIANECNIPVTINDGNIRAAGLIRKNAFFSGLPIEVLNMDVNALLSTRYFHAVDLDPFGTPAPFADAGIRGTGRYLFVTATDTAPLCGAHRKAGIRRYGAHPLNTAYHREVGLRILLGFMVRQAARYDRGVEPLFCFSHEHFVRLHLQLTRGAPSAEKTLSRLGFIMQCPHCANRSEFHGLLPHDQRCDYCHHDMIPVGPLWLGSVSDPRMLTEMAEHAGRMPLGTGPELEKLIRLCREELPVSSFYDYHQLAKSLRVSPPPIAGILEELGLRGFKATRTHYSGTGIRTDAPLAEVYVCLSQKRCIDQEKTQ